MATLRDVALRAGVSIGSASAVVNGTAPVSPEMRTKVLRAVEELGYSPDGIARSLRLGRTRTIGLVVPDITNPHFSTVARVTERVCIAAGYMTFVYNTGEDTDHEMQILRMMRMQSVAGLILISTRSDASHGARLMAEINVPTVLMGSHVQDVPFDVITLDEVRAGQVAIRHLLDLGHRRIGVISGRTGVSTHEERLEGCRVAFAERGLALDERLIVPANFAEAEAFDAARRLLSGHDQPTAIMTLSILMTVGLMRSLVAMELKSPQDVSIIGIDDFDWAAIMNPQPCTVAQPIVEMTEVAIATLLDQIETGKPPAGRRLLFEPKLVIRASCAPVG